MVQIQHPIEEIPVIVVGAGPVGMLLAYGLDQLGVPCLLAERSLDTTKWPKMDLTNCRSMELLRVLGLADEYRNLEGSVGPEADFDSYFVTRAVGEGKLLGAWVSSFLHFRVSVQLICLSEFRDDRQSPSNASLSRRIMTAASLPNQVIDACRFFLKPG